MLELQYPFDADHILRKKKSIRKQLLARENVKYIEKKIAVLGGSTTSDVVLMLELFLLDNDIKPVFYESEYNKFWEDAVFGNEELDSFDPDLVYFHTTSRNINNWPTVRDTAEAVEELAQTEFDRFRLRASLIMGMRTVVSGFAKSNPSGNPFVSFPKTMKHLSGYSISV